MLLIFFQNSGVINFFNHKYLTGTQHPDTKRIRNNSIFKKLLRLKNSIINTIIFTKKYNLNPQSILFLLFATGGKSSYHYGFNIFKGPLMSILNIIKIDRFV